MISNGFILADLMEHVLPHPMFKIGNYSVSNHQFMICLSALILLLLFSLVGSRARTSLVPTGIHNFFESILSFLRTEVFRPALGENADRFTPFLWTVFFFILFCNLLGLVPMGEVIALASKGKIEGAWGTATANFSVTGGLAILAFVTVHLSGIIQQVRIKMDPSLDPHHHGHDYAKVGHGDTDGPENNRDVGSVGHVGDGHDHAHGLHHSTEFHGQPFPVALVTGFGSYVWNFAPHPDTGIKAMDYVLWVVLLILEGIGALVKPFSLCIRLFANMLAGHLVLGALVAMIPFAMAAYAWGPISVIVIAGCTALSLLELFVCFLQAYIFTFLTCLFLASAVAPEH